MLNLALISDLAYPFLDAYSQGSESRIAVLRGSYVRYINIRYYPMLLSLHCLTRETRSTGFLNQVFEFLLYRT